MKIKGIVMRKKVSYKTIVILKCTLKKCLRKPNKSVTSPDAPITANMFKHTTTKCNKSAINNVKNKQNSIFLNFLQNKGLFIFIIPFLKCQKINLVLPQPLGVPTNPSKPRPNDRTPIYTVLCIFFL